MNLKPTSKRGAEWLDFSVDVILHVEEYTVPQYGDDPDDEVAEWSAVDCVRAIRKYTGRFGTNARPGEEKLDLMKMAHFACLAAHKLEKEAP